MSIHKISTQRLFGPETSVKKKNYKVSKHVDSFDWFDRYSAPSRRGAANTVGSNALERRNFMFWFFIIAACLGVLVIRLLYLQIFQFTEYKAIADGNRIRIRTVHAVRGTVFDRNDVQLVKNVPQFSLTAIPVDIPSEESDRSKVVNFIATISGMTADEVELLLEEQPDYSYTPLTIVNGLTTEDAIEIKPVLNQYQGVGLSLVSGREYVYGSSTPSMAHVLGYLSKLNPDKLDEYLSEGYVYDDTTGAAGLEMSYENILRGAHGREHVEVDALGLTQSTIAYEQPIEGSDLLLALDVELQQVAEKALVDIMEENGKQRGSVVIMDPRNGDILSLVSYPGYNNNDFSGGISSEKLNLLFNDENRPLFNRAISGGYPSGSTFKMIVAAAALQENIITQSTGFQSVGGVRVNQWFFPDWKAGGHGWTTVTKALAESVNTFFYLIGGGNDTFTGLGIDRIRLYAERFGLSKATGIDLPNEASGFFPSPSWKERVKEEPWYIGDTYNISIGQGDILVTPLQVAQYTSIFASGGSLYQPRMVRGIKGPDDSVEMFKPVLLDEHVVDPEVVQIVNRGLREAVTLGSARRLLSLPIDSAGKTGTAQWSNTKDPHAWFTSFAPYNSPEIVVTVLIEEGEEGSSLGTPVAERILQWWSENRYVTEE